jgi:polysaccharide biosynthesis transport protein
VELIRYWRVLRQRALFIIICPVVAALLAGLITLRLPNVYEANVSLLVHPGQAVDPALAPSIGPLLVSTYAILITEPSLLDKVIADEGLHTDAASLSKQITVTPVPNTLILNVAVRDTDATRATDIANRLALDFIDHLKSIQQSQNLPPSSADNAVVDSPAVLPVEPVSPKPLLNIGVGLLVGLLVGVGLAFLLDYLDQSVRSDEVLRDRIGLAPLGHIAFVPAKPDRRGELVALAGNSPVAEAYRSLRTNLLFSSIDKETKTIVITSASPGEGKSRTAANLAIVLAHAGHLTLLIDADFRRPSLHRMFGKVRNVGLSNLIVAQTDLASVLVQDEQVVNLVVLPSGPTPPNPSELLGSSQMKSLLGRFRQDFGYILLDTPPVNAVTDASVLAAGTDAAILVIDANKATHTAVQHAKQALDRVNARVLGAVLNKLKMAGGGYYQEQYPYSSSPNGSLEESKTRARPRWPGNKR